MSAFVFAHQISTEAEIRFFELKKEDYIDSICLGVVIDC